MKTKKNLELIINDINKMFKDMDKKFKELKINNTINNTELKYDEGRYLGQVIYGKKKGKGIYYYNDGDKYDGEYKNAEKDGKGIFYYNDGDKYDSEFKNFRKIRACDKKRFRRFKKKY